MGELPVRAVLHQAESYTISSPSVVMEYWWTQTDKTSGEMLSTAKTVPKSWKLSVDYLPNNWTSGALLKEELGKASFCLPQYLVAHPGFCSFLGEYTIVWLCYTLFIKGADF